MNMLSRSLNRISRFADRLYDMLLHYTIFHRKLTGEVTFYGMDEPEAVDGYLVLKDTRFNRTAVYGYHFENRYMLCVSPQKRCAAVWLAAMMQDAIKPLAVIENNRAFTPYGSYDTVPDTYARLLREASEPMEV